MLTRRGFLGGSAVALAGCAHGPAGKPASVPPRRVLWAANVRNKPLPERLDAARAGGFTAMSAFPIDYLAWRRTMSVAEIRRRCADAGVEPAIVDPFVQWVPGFEIPAGYPAENVAFIDHSEADVLRAAAELGATQVNCVEGLGATYASSQLVDGLGAFTDRAAREGLSVTLEPMPISSIRTLSDGWALVGAVARRDFRLTFDSWHFFRSDPDYELLAQIPGDRIAEVQLADGEAELQGSLLEDLLHHRRVPGDGSFDLRRTVEILRRTGALRSVGPELFSDEMDALSGPEVGRVTGDALNRYLKTPPMETTS